MQDDLSLGFAYRFVPGAGNPPSPWTLLLLHGTGGDESDLLDVGRSLSPTAALLSPRGPVLENGSRRFFRRLAEGVFDLPDLHRRTADLAAFVRAAAAAHGLDGRRVAAVGYSNGANIAGSLLLGGSGVLAAAALLRPMVPFEPDPAPDLAGVPVFIAGGSDDPLVPVEQTERLARVLRAAGAQVTVAVQPGAGHGLTPADLAAARAWFRRLESTPADT